MLLVAPPAGAGPSSNSLATSRRRPWRRYDGLADSAWTVTRLGRSVQTVTADVADFTSDQTDDELTRAKPSRGRFQLIISALDPEPSGRFDFASWARALAPDGRFALLTHCYRQHGRWVDIGSGLRAAGYGAGLRLIDHIAVLQMPLNAVAKHPSPTAGERQPLAIVHADLYVFASAMSAARSGR